MDKMSKKERKMRLENHKSYWDLADTIRDTSLNALSESLSVDDVISVLDRVKTELIQREVVVEIEGQMQESTDDDSEDDDMSVEIPQVGIKTPVPLVDPTGLAEEATRGMYS